MRIKRAFRRALWVAVIVLLLVGILFVWASRPSTPRQSSAIAPKRAPAAPTAAAPPSAATSVSDTNGGSLREPPDSSRAAGPTSGDPLQPLLPDPRRTPGATFDVGAAEICVRGYSRQVRHVPGSVKHAVYRSYGITDSHRHRYEVDHLISLELGGSNAVANLWPQSFETAPWNASVKDALENELHRRVCNGSLDLPTAQRAIATDWIAAYKVYVGTGAPPSASGAR